MRFCFEEKRFIELEIEPLKNAVVGSDETLNWNEFRLRVEKIVYILDDLEIPKGHPVMVYGHKEASFIVAKTALLIYGSPYVPADIIFPLERILMMKEECNSEVFLNCGDDEVLQEDFTIYLSVKSLLCSAKKYVTSSLSHLTTAENPLSYILFTSGSTGRPKGVPIGEIGVKSFASWLKKHFGISTKDSILNVSALSFDFASFEEYLFLNCGSTLVLASYDDLKDSDLLLNKIKRNQISVWVSTPSLVFKYLTEPLFNGEELPSLNCFVFAGEALPLATVKKLQMRFPNAKIWNAYGPSEATNLTTAAELTELDIENLSAIPIGYPKTDSEILLLNKDEEGIGEICIVGDHVTNGYLNNEALNSEKFFLHNGKKAYKSGDLGFFKENLLFYAGRNDEMVKLHGYRIELDDISSQIENVPSITKACTIGLKNKGETKKIVSFFCASKSLNKLEIISFISKNLPEYMIPSDFRQIDEIPLNVSGKADKKMLEKIYLQK